MANKSDELKRETEAHVETFLASELGSQTCPICFELMLPPRHSPKMLVPCGHTFCNSCLQTHLDENKRSRCPLCRENVTDRVQNQSLQRLLEAYAAQRNVLDQKKSALAESRRLDDGDMSNEPAVPDSAPTSAKIEEYQRRYQTAALRSRILGNELAESVETAEKAEDAHTTACLVRDHIRAQRDGIQKRLEEVQRELQVANEHLSQQDTKCADMQHEAETAQQRTELLTQTLESVHGEIDRYVLILQQLDP
eukprot:Rmarinus@m.8965